MVINIDVLRNRDSLGRFNSDIKTNAKERFWQYVEKTDYCWLWKGGGIRYGKFYDGIQDILAHRYSYELHYGKIDNGLYVCHKCDNPKCVNPNHLFLGTQKDNLQDATFKHRMNVPHNSCGEKNVNSKLREEDVLEIRKLVDAGVTGTKIAKQFHIHHATVYDIKNRKIWTHI
jgi:hypothetical protein